LDQNTVQQKKRKALYLRAFRYVNPPPKENMSFCQFYFFFAGAFFAGFFAAAFLAAIETS